MEEGGGGVEEVGAPRRFSSAWKNVGPFARAGLLMGESRAMSNGPD